jgi:hypothetical protein
LVRAVDGVWRVRGLDGWGSRFEDRVVCKGIGWFTSGSGVELAVLVERRGDEW